LQTSHVLGHSAMPSFAVAILVAYALRGSHGFCPKGFGAGNFPKEYKIPVWPTDMPMEESAKLHTVKLGGFKMPEVNEEYLEGPTKQFVMQGRSTFWQASGQYFMYFCRRFMKWRIAEISAFSKNMDGQCFAFVSDASPNRDVLNSSHLRGFIEVENGEWKMREDAGVRSVGRLGDQMDIDEEEFEEVEEEGSCEAPSEEQPQSKCPVKRIARKVVQVATDAGKWARRLFPKYLGSPDEEDAIPDVGNPLFEAAEGQGSCEPVTLKDCSIKEQYYIEKQKKSTSEQWQAELRRLGKMANVAMKPEQKQWVTLRALILQKMVAKEKAAA